MGLIIEDILSNNCLRTFFQPTVSVKTGEIVGYEALTRGPDGPLYTPLALFSEAKRYNRVAELDQLCRSTILRRASEKHLEGLLFINIDPIVIYHPETSVSDLTQSKESGIERNRIVLEFTMTEDICQFVSFIDLVQDLKQNGYRIACDNTVPGSTAFLSLLHMYPDYIKVDFSKVDDVNESIQQGALTLAQLTHAQPIAVGVQSAEQLRMLVDNGIVYAQGNFLAKPSETVPVLREEARVLLRELAAEQRPAT